MNDLQKIIFARQRLEQYCSKCRVGCTIADIINESGIQTLSTKIVSARYTTAGFYIYILKNNRVIGSFGDFKNLKCSCYLGEKE